MENMTALDILQDLISIDTVNPPGNEYAAAVYLERLLAPYGFHCEIHRLGDNRANFVGSLGSGNGPVLTLCGHLDVVPVNDSWTREPFVLTREGGRVYGRGAADMKGGIAAMCEMAIRMARQGGPANGTLKLVFVADEEDANRGMKAYLEQNRENGWAIIGEPTELNLAIAHRGVSRDIIEIYGYARHAALPEDGLSALAKLPSVFREVERMNRILEKRLHPVLPPPSIAVTRLDAYEKDNIVPGTVRLLTDFRILPGMDESDARAFLHQGFAEAGIEKIQIKNHFFMKGGEIRGGDPFVLLCCEAGKTVLNHEVIPQAFPASCEQCFLEEAGIQTVIFGPGSIEQAHTVDEFLEVSQLDGASRFYEAVAGKILR